MKKIAVAVATANAARPPNTPPKMAPRDELSSPPLDTLLLLLLLPLPELDVSVWLFNATNASGGGGRF
jgi:hypothetical protein